LCSEPVLCAAVLILLGSCFRNCPPATMRRERRTNGIMPRDRVFE
jgi:hypothetical protein